MPSGVYALDTDGVFASWINRDLFPNWEAFLGSTVFRPVSYTDLGRQVANASVEEQAQFFSSFAQVNASSPPIVAIPRMEQVMNLLSVWERHILGLLFKCEHESWFTRLIRRLR